MIFYCMPGPHFVYRRICCWPCGLLPLFPLVNNAAVNTGEQACAWVLAFNCLGSIPRSGLADSYGNYLFNFWRNHHMVLTYLHLLFSLLFLVPRLKVGWFLARFPTHPVFTQAKHATLFLLLTVSQSCPSISIKAGSFSNVNKHQLCNLEVKRYYKDMP